jgi:histidinol-phosphate phosphatase family protein
MHILIGRDGTINRRKPKGFVASWDEFEFLPGVREALRILAAIGCAVIVVSNQAAVGKGLMTAMALENLTRRFRNEVENAGGHIDAVYYCTHRREDGCPCRKPNPGLLWEAQRDHKLVLQDTFLIGDSEIDACTARAARCRFIRLTTSEIGAAERGRQHALAEVPDLRNAVTYILEHAMMPAMATWSEGPMRGEEPDGAWVGQR